MINKKLPYFLKRYLKEKPVFLSLIRAKEAKLFQKYVPLKGPVLDVGCGDGFFAKIALFGKSEVGSLTDVKASAGKWKSDGTNKKLIDVGLDVKDSRVEEARKMDIYKNIVIYDGEKIPFKNNTFNTVISNCVLEHIIKLDMTSKEVYRVLKPGGLFIATVATKNWEEYLFGNFIFGDIYKKWMRKKQVHFNLLTNKQWKITFKKQGFKIVQEIGYLDKKAVRWIDLLHYLSISSLITYKLFGKWVLWKDKLFLFPLRFLSNLISPNIDPRKSGNIFFAITK